MLWLYSISNFLWVATVKFYICNSIYHVMKILLLKRKLRKCLHYCKCNLFLFFFFFGISNCFVELNNFLSWSTSNGCFLSYLCRAHYNCFIFAIDAHIIKLAFFKISSNFVNFCPIFQIFCPFLPFLWKIASMPFL